MRNLLIEIIISFLLIIFGIIIILKKENLKLKELHKHPTQLILIFILIIGIIIRIIAIENYPIGLNQDEASIGYEAYSIANYGIDRNGNTYPVHLIAWGSGQNALYAYLIIPFIKLFGLNVLTVRLPMAIIGCITLLVVLLLCKSIKFKDKRVEIIILFLTAIMPWHIIKSRWGLESNLFPDLIFYSMVLFYFGIKEKRKIFYIFANIILGISAYSYGTSYLFLPVLALLLYGYLLYKKQLTIKDVILYIFIIGIVSAPIILFVIINYFDLNQFKIFKIFTVPKLYFNRFMSITNLNGGNFLTNSIANLKQSLYIIVNQKDSQVLNYVGSYGIYYIYSLPFIILGIYYSIKDKTYFLKINNCVFLTSIILCCFVQPNINRINIIWVSMIIYLVYGIYKIYRKDKQITYVFLFLYLLSFLMFSMYYFKNYNNDIGTRTYDSAIEAIQYTDSLNYKNLYITPSIGQNYIFYLFSKKIDPNFYNENKILKDKNVQFQKVLSMKNIYYTLPAKLENGNVYILSLNEINLYDTEEYNKKYYTNYVVLY